MLKSLLCPMKNYKKAGPTLYGTVRKLESNCVYLLNVFDFQQKESDGTYTEIKKMEYSDTDALFADGWQVD